jgi:hypothetical protein
MGGELSVGRRLSRMRAEAIQAFVQPGDYILELGMAELSAELAAAKSFASGIESIAEWSQLSAIDVAICDHVLEYTVDPIEPLTALKKILKPGGKLIVCTLYDPAFRRPRLKGPVDHYYSWNVQTLGNLLINCGFEFRSGNVLRVPNAQFARRCVERWRLGETGFRFVARFSQWFCPDLEVRLVARRP